MTLCINILSSSHGPISFVETPSNVHIITLKNVGDRQLPSILLCTSSIHQSNWFLACKFLNKVPLSLVEFFKLTVDQTFLTSFISLSLTQSTNYFKLTHPKPHNLVYCNVWSCLLTSSFKMFFQSAVWNDSIVTCALRCLFHVTYGNEPWVEKAIHMDCNWWMSWMPTKSHYGILKAVLMDEYDSISFTYWHNDTEFNIVKLSSWIKCPETYQMIAYDNFFLWEN